MQKFLIGLVALVAVFGLMIGTADAAYKIGSPQGSAMSVGNDAGSTGIADVWGDIAGSYTSNLLNDTAFKTTGGVVTATISAVFGDTAEAVGPASATVVPGDTASFTMRLVNWSNASDSFELKVIDTAGPSGDSITVYINNVKVFDSGTQFGTPFYIGPLAAGADSTVSISVVAKSAANGAASLYVKAIARGGAGGDTDGYTGWDGISYAGDGNDSMSLTVNVNFINVLMAIVMDTMGTPSNYGTPGDTVPGSYVMYRIDYDNDGNDTAFGFTVNAKIPQFSELSDTPIDAPHSGALATVTITDDSGVPAAVGPNASRIRWTFNQALGPNVGDAIGTVNSASDYDQGRLWFKVYIK